MQSPTASVPVTACTGDEGWINFPEDLREVIDEHAMNRSRLLLDWHNAGVSSVLTVPAKLCKAWLECVWKTHKQLKATDDDTLVLYLEVRFIFLVA